MQDFINVTYPFQVSNAIVYLCVTDAKHSLNDPHSDKNAIMSTVLIS